MGVLALGATTLGGAAVMRAVMDEASHAFFHTNRLSPGELATESLAGALADDFVTICQAHLAHRKVSF